MSARHRCARWAAATAQRARRLARRTGLPNQDAVRVARGRRRRCRVWSPRSPTATAASATCAATSARASASRSPATSAADVLRPRSATTPTADGRARQLDAAVAADDRRAVARARCSPTCAAAPFTDEERARAGAPLDADPLISYGVHADPGPHGADLGRAAADRRRRRHWRRAGDTRRRPGARRRPAGRRGDHLAVPARRPPPTSASRSSATRCPSSWCSPATATRTRSPARSGVPTPASTCSDQIDRDGLDAVAETGCPDGWPTRPCRW